MPKSKVLHILSSLERSGMEMMLLCSEKEWERHGYKCDVLATAENIGPLAQELREAGYSLFHLPFRSNHHYLPRLHFIAEFYKLCRSGYSVVHVHVQSAAPIYVLIAKMAGVKRVALTPHNVFRFHGLLRVRTFFERHFSRLLGASFGMISEGVRKCELETYQNVGVRIWNWIDTDRFRPPTPQERRHAREILGCEEQRFVIVSVGNCNRVKNHPELIRALSMLPDTLNFLYLHVGKEDLEQSERQLAALLGITDKTRFCGSQSDIRQYLWAADMYAMPSLVEGFSISAIEAIATGVPSLFASTEGLIDVAFEAEHTVFCGTNSQSIADGILEIVALSPAQRRERALADSDRIRSKFSIANGVESIVKGLYMRNSAQY